jgi:outer membrane receptor protein involved in Fe transport
VPSAVRAEDSVDPFTEADEADLFRTEQRVVTVASRTAQSVREAPSIVDVLTDREIRARGYRTLGDLLRSMAGVYVSTSQEGRSLAWFRGVVSPDNNRFLILVDGVPWYDGIYTHGWIDEYLPLESVKQVEIIKGPGSAVYGTNAFAGVINVVTYRAQDLQGGFVRAIAGSDGRIGASAVMAEQLKAGDRTAEVRASVRLFDADGDGLEVNPKGQRNVTGTNPRRGIAGKIGLTFEGFDFNLDVIDYRHTYLTQPQDEALDILLQDDDTFWLGYRNVMAQASYQLRLGAIGTLRPHLWWQSYDNSSHYAYFGSPSTTSPSAGEYETELKYTLVEAEKISQRWGGGVDLDLRPGPRNHTVAGTGVDITRVSSLVDNNFVDSTGEPTKPSSFIVRDPNAQILDAFGFIQHTFTAAGWLQFTGGARLDWHSYFGTFASPRAGVLLIPNDVFVLKALYGRAFRAPTARELLVSVGIDDEGSNQFVAGNPDLRPETIDTVELEASFNPNPGIEFRAAGFASFLNNEINSVYVEGGTRNLGDYYYANQGATNIIGAEAEARYAIANWDLESSLSWTQATNTTMNRTQYGFPPLMAHGVVGYALLDQVRLRVLADWFSAQPRQQWTPNSKLGDGPAYGLVHAGLATDALADGRVRVDVSVRNLLNTQYETLIYSDEADATTTNDQGQLVPKYPRDIQGEGRTFVVGVEVPF